MTERRTRTPATSSKVPPRLDGLVNALVAELVEAAVLELQSRENPRRDQNTIDKDGAP